MCCLIAYYTTSFTSISNSKHGKFITSHGYGNNVLTM